MAQMPSEGDLFTQVDRTYRRLMADCNEMPGVLTVCGKSGLLESIEDCNLKLEQILKGVIDHYQSAV